MRTHHRYTGPLSRPQRCRHSVTSTTRVTVIEADQRLTMEGNVVPVCLPLLRHSQGHACTLRTRTEGRRISNALGLLLRGGFLFHLSGASGRLRCPVTGVPPQPNSPSERCPEAPAEEPGSRDRGQRPRLAHEAEGPRGPMPPYPHHHQVMCCPPSPVAMVDGTREMVGPPNPAP